MGKIFKPRIKINEMAPQWSSGSVLSKDFLDNTKKQLLKLYYSGEYTYYTIPLLEVELLHTKTPISVGGENCLAYFVVHNDKVVFLSCYKDMSYVEIPYSPVTQALVWRDKEDDYAKAVIPYVVWQRLFKEHHALVTDSTQTDKGKSLWAAIIQQAYGMNYEIYLLDTYEETVIDATNYELDHLFEFVRNSYGSGEKYKYRLIAVCDPKYKEA